MSVEIDITCMVGDLENVTGPSGRPIIRGLASSRFGVDDTGPYFNTTGANPGERALVSIDSSGELVITLPADLVDARGTDGQRFAATQNTAPSREHPRDHSGRLFGPGPPNVVHSPRRRSEPDRLPDGRLFRAAPMASVERADARRPDGRLFVTAPSVQPARRDHRDVTGRLFTTAPRPVASRSDRRRSDGHLFEPTPIHAR